MDIQSIKYIKCRSNWNPGPIKWIGFLMKWVLNGLDRSKSRSDQENWIFLPTPKKTKWTNLKDIHTSKTNKKQH